MRRRRHPGRGRHHLRLLRGRQPGGRDADQRDRPPPRHPHGRAQLCRHRQHAPQVVCVPRDAAPRGRRLLYLAEWRPGRSRAVLGRGAGPRLRQVRQLRQPRRPRRDRPAAVPRRRSRDASRRPLHRERAGRQALPRGGVRLHARQTTRGDQVRAQSGRPARDHVPYRLTGRRRRRVRRGAQVVRRDPRGDDRGDVRPLQGLREPAAGQGPAPCDRDQLGRPRGAGGRPRRGGGPVHARAQRGAARAAGRAGACPGRGVGRPAPTRRRRRGADPFHL